MDATEPKTGNIYLPLEDSTDGTGKAGSSSSPSRWAIRCLRLEPGKSNDKLKCELIYSHLGDIGSKYEALSYTWGDTSEKVVISLNGQPFGITRNLHSALRFLRNPHHGRILWIDALCINQADMYEVNQYVGRMWAIFEKAHTVVVFLGEPNKGSDQALKFLLELSSLPLEAGDRHRHIIELLRNRRKSHQWNSLRALMQRPWWDRAWIIQEYAVARRLLFLCGTGRLGGDEFNQAMDYLIDFKFNALVPQSSLELVRIIASTPISHLLTVRRSYQLPGAPPNLALDILYRSRRAKAADPRDKVYSLFRLIHENPILQPDYSRSTQDVYKSVVKATIESSGTLEILSHHNRGTVGLPGLPSWCPDWSVMHGKRLLLCTKEYSAAGSSRTQAQICGDTLTLRGVILDRIQWRSRKFRSGDFGRSKNLHAAIMDIQSTVLEKAVAANRSGAEITREFLETLVTSRVRQRGPDGWKTRVLEPSAIEEMWNAWCLSLDRAHRQDNGETSTKTLDDAMYSALCGRAFFVSEKGYLGIVDPDAQIGDAVAVALGGQVLFALHELPCELSSEPESTEPARTEPTSYHLIGEW